MQPFSMCERPQHGCKLPVAMRPILPHNTPTANSLLHSKFKCPGCSLRSGRTSGRGTRCGPSPGKAAARCALRAQIILQNESHVFHLRAAACGVRASSATNCGPPPGGGCGPLGPNGPIPTRDKPAAERTGLRRRGAVLRPGRLRAADRCAIDFAGKHFHPNLRAADVCDVEFIARHPKNNSRADEQRRPPGNRRRSQRTPPPGFSCGPSLFCS